MRVDKEISADPGQPGPIQGDLGRGYGHGWGARGDLADSGGEIRTDTIVTIETLVYGLRENKVLWRGQSETTNPRNVNRLIEDAAEQVVNELARLGLIEKSRLSSG